MLVWQKPYLPANALSYIRALKFSHSSHELPAVYLEAIAEQLPLKHKQRARYNALLSLTTAIDQSGVLPVCWPNILTFPLQLYLLTHSLQPLPVIGVIHLRNRIHQYRSIHINEPLSAVCQLTFEPEPRGILLQLKTEVFNAGERLWQQHAGYLYRLAGNITVKDKKPLSAPLAFCQEIASSAAIARQYGWLSGDLNLIHLGRLSARLLGQKNAIMHGMWTKAICLSRLTNLPEACEIDVAFNQPLYCGDSAMLSAEGQQFRLHNTDYSRLHLSGQWRPLL